jgi:hypothetical protein
MPWWHPLKCVRAIDGGEFSIRKEGHSITLSEALPVAVLAFDAVSSQIPAMSVRSHRFKVGQTVVAPYSGLHGLTPRGPYVIVRLLPLVDGEPQYRVRSADDGHERALLESQIRLIEERPGNVMVPLARPSRKGTKDRR